MEIEQISFAFERLCTIIRGLLWDASFKLGLNPIQFQVLTFFHQKKDLKVTSSLLAERFNVSNASMSDTLNSLSKKKLIIRKQDKSDKRIFYISISSKGMKLVEKAKDWDKPIKDYFSSIPEEDSVTIFISLLTLLRKLYKDGIINYLRMCYSCKWLSVDINDQEKYFCSLLKMPLEKFQLRVDCPDHSVRENNEIVF